MKKLFIAASLIIGMVASAMVLSSFSEPKEMKNDSCTEITMADGWTKVGDYRGKTRDERKSAQFRIWEKEGMCNQYYWVLYDGSENGYENPDETQSSSGVLRQNRDGEWYAAYYGENYYIDF